MRECPLEANMSNLNFGAADENNLVVTNETAGDNEVEAVGECDVFEI